MVAFSLGVLFSTWKWSLLRWSLPIHCSYYYFCYNCYCIYYYLLLLLLQLLLLITITIAFITAVNYFCSYYHYVLIPCTYFRRHCQSPEYPHFIIFSLCSCVQLSLLFCDSLTRRYHSLGLYTYIALLNVYLLSP